MKHNSIVQTDSDEEKKSTI